MPGRIGTVTHIKIHVFPFAQHAGVEGVRLARARRKHMPVFKVHMAVKFVLTRGSIAYGDGDHAHEVERVIKIIAPVGSAADVGREQSVRAVRIERVLPAAVDDALIPPAL